MTYHISISTTEYQQDRKRCRAAYWSESDELEELSSCSSCGDPPRDMSEAAPVENDVKNDEDNTLMPFGEKRLKLSPIALDQICL